MTGIVIQARMGSTRLPGKVLRKIGNKCLLEHILDRLETLKIKNCKVVVATTIKEQDDVIEEFCRKKGVSCFRGSEQNVLERYWMCTKKYNFDNVVRLTADNPFVDTEELERLISMHCLHQAEYSYSDTELPEGMGAEIFSRDALKKSVELSDKENHFEHVDDYILENMDSFYTLKLNVEPDKICPDIRLTVDTLEDYKKACYFAEQASESGFSVKEAIKLERQYQSGEQNMENE